MGWARQEEKTGDNQVGAQSSMSTIIVLAFCLSSDLPIRPCGRCAESEGQGDHTYLLSFFACAWVWGHAFI